MTEKQTRELARTVEELAMNKKIEKLRLSLGMTQSEFAKKVNSNRTSVGLWERGKVKPRKLAMHQIEKLNGGKPL